MILFVLYAGADRVSNFLEQYINFCCELTDAPRKFHEFTGYALVGVLLGREVYFPFGGNTIYPNFYMTLIAPSSIYRKSTALTLAAKIIRAINPERILPAEFSQEALLEVLSFNSSGTFLFYEFKSLLGQLEKDYMQGAKAFLTEIFDCVDDKTEILTDNGWKNMDTIKQNDLALTLNMRTELLEYKKINRIIKKESTEIICLKSKSINQRVTPNHNVLFRYRKETKAKQNLRFRKAKTLIGKGTDIILRLAGNLPDKGINVPDEIIALSAWVITDGSVNRGSVEIYQNKSKLPLITQLLNKANIPYSAKIKHKKGTPKMFNNKTYFANEDNYRVRLNIKHNYWKNYLLCKHIPHEYKTMSERQFNLFLGSLIDGDGSHYSKNSKLLTTNRKDIVDDLQELAVKCGWATHSTKYKSRNAYWIYFNKKTESHFNGNSHNCKNQRISKLDGDFHVWCLSTDNETIVCRREGKTFITGNCPSYYRRKTRSIDIMIEHPCISLLAATTMDWFTERVKSGDFEGGFLNRFLFVPVNKKEKSMAIPPKMDEDVLSRLVLILKDLLMYMKNKEMSLTAEARTMYVNWYNSSAAYMEHQKDDLRFCASATRMQIYLIKFAMLTAIIDNRATVIDEGNMLKAIQLVDWLTKQTEYLLKTEVHGSKFEKQMKNIIRILEKEGGECSWSHLLNRSNLKTKELQETVQTLEERQELTREKELEKGAGCLIKLAK